MKTISEQIKEVGDLLIDLADKLSHEDCEITSNELLENIAGRSISEESAGHIKDYLSK